MKYVYVLVSDETDYYYEETLLSITSLRLQMPQAFITLLADDTTQTNLAGKRSKLLELVNEYKPVAIDEQQQQFSKMARSRWLKTSMRQLVTDDFLYIDADTVVADDLSPVTDMEGDIGAVLNCHESLSELAKYNSPEYKRFSKYIYKHLGFSDFKFDSYFNGGVFFCRDSKAGHVFFGEWHKLWLSCHSRKQSADQPSLNQTNYALGNVIKELPGIWNCQIVFDGAIRFLHEAKIIHYFATQSGEKAFILSKREYFDRIKETGSIEENLLEMLKNPKSLFSPNARIILLDKSFREFYSSAFCGMAKKMYYTRMGRAAEFILGRIRERLLRPMRRKKANRKL